MKKPILLIAVMVYCLLNHAHSQTISTVAGTGISGYSRDEIPATVSPLYWPWGVAADALGNIYIADYDNNRIRKVDAAGIVHTIAGNGTTGYLGDGGPSTAAVIFHPVGVTADSAGNVYFSDNGNNVIRKIDLSGVISTIVGNSTPGYLGDHGPATNAELHGPGGLVLDKAGNLYFADGTNYAVRKVDVHGIITTIGGNGTSGYSGDNGPATIAQLDFPNDVTVDINGNVYLDDASNARLRKIDTFGIITTIAGNGTGGFIGDGIPATAAEIGGPGGLDVNAAGEVIFGDYYNSRIVKVDKYGMLVTIAGTGTMGYSGDGGPATAAEMTFPNKVVFDYCGNIYMSDIGKMVIRKITMPNHAPAFAKGHSQSIVVCKNSAATAIDTILAVIDSDAGQTENWATINAPAHGTLLANFTSRSTGGKMTPVGLTYKPTAAYTGTDSFSVQATDCNGTSDTVTVHVSVINCPLEVNPLSTGSASISVYPNPAYKGRFTVELQSSLSENVVYTITNIVGEQVKEVTSTTNTSTDVSINVPAGIYFIKASTAHGSRSTKIIVADQ